MNKKAKTKAWKADEDANLDEALDESFPASDARFALFNIKWDIAEESKVNDATDRKPSYWARYGHQQPMKPAALEIERGRGLGFLERQ
jgi:hypothetical protein